MYSHFLYLFSSKSDISVPPTKKRRSKWDMVTTETETTTSGAAAAAAAAKINAMLAAKGKLTKPDNVILVSRVFLYVYNTCAGGGTFTMYI